VNSDVNRTDNYGRLEARPSERNRERERERERRLGWSGRATNYIKPLSMASPMIFIPSIKFIDRKRIT
jgi:hypothetical protein